MPTYKYLCESCGSNYSETRLESHPQFRTECNCGTQYKEVIGE